MADYADLEIASHRHDAEGYRVELRFTQPASDAETFGRCRAGTL